MLQKAFSLKIIVSLICCMYLQLSAQSITRHNQGSVLELKDKVWVGAGQAGMTGFDGFENYWNIAPEGLKPNVFSDYYDTWNMNEKWSLELKEELLKFHRQGYYVVPQFGINIFYLWKAYLDGSQDDELENLVKGLKFLAIPAFIRIGYEFNNPPGGMSNEDYYKVDQFKDVYVKFAKKLKESGLEVACVWNIGLASSSSYWQHTDYADAFPDPQYVDWVSFNTFTTDLNGGDHPLIHKCIALAKEHSKPILIGEASMNWPINVVNNNDGDYDRFCGPYFGFVKGQPLIKQTTYINWDWDIQDMVGGNGLFPWGDSRLQTAGSGYRSNFFKDINDPIFFHAASEAETRKNLMISYTTEDKEAPSQVTGLKREGRYLRWNPVNEKGGSKLAHYTIYKDGKLWDYTIDPEYEVKYLSWGDRADVTITAMDRAGNESAVSSVLQVRQDQAVEKIWDGEFDYPSTSAAVDWRWMGCMDGGAKNPPDGIAIDTTGKLSGKNSCFLHNFRLSASSPENFWRKMPHKPQDWKLQLFQCFQVKKGEKYNISFKAVAEEARTIQLYFMDNHIAPDHTHLPSNGTVEPTWQDGKEWEYYEIWKVDIGTEPKDYTFSSVAPATETARLSFMMGKCEPTNMWIDKVSVLEGQGASIRDNNALNHSKNRINLSVVTNQTHTIAKIKYTLPKQSVVSMHLYNNAGKRIVSVANTRQAKGTHVQTLKTEGLASGIYFLRLKAGKNVSVANVIIAR